MKVKRKWQTYRHKRRGYTFGIGISIHREAIIINFGFWHWFFEWIKERGNDLRKI